MIRTHETKDRVYRCLVGLRAAVAQFSPQVRLDSIAPLPNQGKSNIIFRAELKSGVPCVIRTSLNPRRFGYRYFDKEHWIIRQLMSRGILTARLYSEIHEFARVDGGDNAAYYLAEYLEGDEGEQVAKKGTLEQHAVYRTLGAILHAVSEIQCVGFGTSFHSESEAFLLNWPEALDEELTRYGEFSPHINGELNTQQIARFRQRRAALIGVMPEGRLAHGDLNLSNLLLLRDGSAALLDWEQALSTIAPAGNFMLLLYQKLIIGARYSTEELRKIFKKDGLVPELSALLEGHGIAAHEYACSHREITETLLLSRIIPFLSWWQRQIPRVRGEWANAYGAARTLAPLLLPG